jgi:pimeloyl-ACP methyl ester carboxylesterase
VHYRSAGRLEPGGRPPLYLAHGGPGSSLSMVPLMAGLAPSRFVLAPDMLGNGDSAPPPRADMRIEDYAEAAVRLLDRLGIDRVDFYGSHTGAQIGCALGVQWPDRVGRLILDGLPLFDDALKARLLRDYAPPVVPDDEGDHLLWAWRFYRNQFRYFPHFMTDPEHRLDNPVPPAGALHAGVVEVLKALATYRIAYQAAFAQDVRGLLPRIAAPVLLMAAARDPLHAYLDQAAALLPTAEKLLLPAGASADAKVAALLRFLGSE